MTAVEIAYTDSAQTQGSNIQLTIPGPAPDDTDLVALAVAIKSELGEAALGLDFGTPPYHVHSITVRTETTRAVTLP